MSDFESGGSPQPSYIPPPIEMNAKTSGLAVASLILGVLGFCTLGITALFGIILGIVSLVQISGSRGRLGGAPIAVIGLIVSGFCILFIPIMGAILFPVFVQAREQARSTACQENLKHLSQALNFYKVDNQEHFPLKEQWATKLGHYIKLDKAFECPSSLDTSQGYSYNKNLSGVAESEIEATETLAVFFDSKRANSWGERELIVYRHGVGTKKRAHTILANGTFRYFSPIYHHFQLKTEE